MSRKKPQRTCLGCRTIRNKEELIRIVRTPEGEVKVDPSGKMNGRGAYLCRSEQCLKKAVKSGALSRSLKAAVSEEVTETLAQQIGAYAEALEKGSPDASDGGGK